ncbi:MAG: ACT domain-containing protein, partial [Acidobacteriota bacterium]|nr:ACT domain-containing protein [Acidobacteriota bacterium]
VRGLASIPRVALARLDGDGMIGIPGIAARLFGALARRHVNVIMISQASSEHSICFAVQPEAVEATALAVAEEFEAELRTEQIDELVLEEDLAIVAAVGAGMCETHGVAGRVFGVLGKAGVNVRAIAQGSSELNISLVVEAADEVKALNAIHGAFFPTAPRKTRAGPKIYLAGVGQVGSALLDQLAELAAGGGPVLRIGGLSRSRGALLSPQGLDPADAAAGFETAQTLVPPQELARAAAADPGPSVFVDCTASSETAALYGELARAGVPVVAANKLRFAGPLEDWRKLQDSLVYYETTVGAALPVVSSLRSLIQAGDRLVRIEAVLSGTLAHVLDEVSNGRRFSEAVLDAQRRGFTEPDPRQDLGGLDVARKILILARVAGRDLELDDLTLEPLLPDASWLEGSVEEFMARLPELDPPIGRRAQAAGKASRRLVYLAELDDRGGRIGLREMPEDHPAATGRGTENVVVMTSMRYDERPLVIRGPGAGPRLTASGVLADVLRAFDESEAF